MVIARPTIPGLKSKLVALRIDINSPYDGKVRMNPRIREHGKTIKMLKRTGARVVVLAHQGRKGKKDFVSLRNHLPLLRKTAGDIGFAGFDFGKIGKMKDGEALLVENVRFLDDQKELESLDPDVFMLDAFSVSHRNEYSVTGFSCPAIPGPVFSREVGGIRNSRKESVFLLGGAKEKEVADLVKARKESVFLLGGVVGCRIAGHVYGLPFGDRKLGKLGKRDNIFYPVDFATGDGKRVEEREPEDMPKDIGSVTIRMFSAILRNAGRVVFSKPLGMYEQGPFAKGTRELYRLISGLDAETIGGGGNTRDAIRRFRIPERRFTYLSLSGGAFLEYAAKRKLPGMERLAKDGWDEESIARAWKPGHGA